MEILEDDLNLTQKKFFKCVLPLNNFHILLNCHKVIFIRKQTNSPAYTRCQQYTFGETSTAVLKRVHAVNQVSSSVERVLNRSTYWPESVDSS